MYMATSRLHSRSDPSKYFQDTREQTVEALISKGFSYSRRLTGHTSCVNYLAFSSGDGRWLASAGDDLRINLFDFHQEDVVSPSCSFVGPRSNVFSLCFSANNRYLYCGATDDKIYKYDLSELSDLESSGAHGSPCDTFLGHDGNIRDITCHPSQDEVSMSASEDGRIILRDGRATNASIAEATLRNASEFTGVRWHPHMEHVFATSDNVGSVCLRDLRMTFGPLSSRSSEPIHQYVTTLSKPSTKYFAVPEISSIVWDRDGSKLAVTILNSFPAIYSLTDKWPLAVCSAAFQPDGSPIPPGQRTYVNSCTIKHGSFGGPALTRDSYYAAGSDDFRGYVWKIPDLADLAARRREVDLLSWPFESPDTAGFGQNFYDPRFVPVNLSTPLFHLNGHQSIVNTALFHPKLLHVATSGIERHIFLHSPTPSSPCTKDLQPTSTEVRSLPERSHDGGGLLFRALEAEDDSSDDSDGEASTIALFDEILRKEGGGLDPFVTRRYIAGVDLEDDDEDIEIDPE